MDLQIKYDNGSMTVHLEEFLGCRKITKFRKLVKLIRQSYTPDELNKILNHIEQFNATYELDQKVTEQKIAGYSDKVRFCERQISRCTALRDSYKKQSENWVTFNDNLKEHKGELKQLNQLLRAAKQEYKNRQKDKAFLEECSIVLQG